MGRFSVLLVAACGTGTPTQPTVEPPPSTKLAQAPDAGVPEPPPKPKLVCDSATAPVAAPAPEPTWYCAKPDGTRHGPFISLFPDGSIEIGGSYKDGQLEGPWRRHHANGAVIESGEYTAGKKTGTWKRASSTGVALGEYEMKDGTGIEKIWLDDGPLYSETPLENGVRHGTQKIYTRDGGLIGSTRYRTGVLDGPHVFGTKNTMRFEETFDDGVRVGRRLIFHQGGLLADEHYRRGKLDGDYTLWRSAKFFKVKGRFSGNRRTGAWQWNDRDGKKEKEGSYVGGRRDGVWNEWFEEKLVWSGTYDKGKPNGTFTYWDKNGNEIGKYEIKDGTGWVYTYWSNKKPSSKQHLYKGYEDGTYQEFTRAGRLVVEGHYAGANNKHGSWKEWNADGVLLMEETWRRGKLHGTVRKYVDGKVSMEASYVDGKADGNYIEYRLGKPSLTGQFADDKRHGAWTSYGADGSVLRIATYKDGQLEGPYRELTNGAVVEGPMVAGRRSGTWTRTDKSGAVRKLTYRAP